MILFAWRRLPPPGFIGGAEISESLVARSLAASGHDVTFVGSFTNPRDRTESWLPWLLELLDHHGIIPTSEQGRLSYRWHGVDCHAIPQNQLLDDVAKLATTADAIWTSQEECPTIRAAAPSLPAASYAHSVSEVGLLSAQLGARWVFAPSQFVQGVINDRWELEAHLLRPPLIGDDGRGPAPASQDRDLVLFINPLEIKGVTTAIELAKRLPATPFVFVESWCPAAENLDLPANVNLLGRIPILSPLYRKARLLIAPSVIDDACPRVILEAAIHGVPALGSNRGGIPELIADQRNVLPVGDIDTWATRAGELLGSATEWATASEDQEALAKSMLCEPAWELANVGFPPAPAAPTVEVEARRVRGRSVR